ncbi:serine acetyltransferase [Novosphingobium sp.]|uniref:serine acetyltransferase n=1 Tax=Novosphingobium sp. TaxID=1874826 RepID=UPI003BAAF9F8
MTHWHQLFAADMKACFPQYTHWKAIYRVKHPVLDWLRSLRWLENLDQARRKNPFLNAVFYVGIFLHRRKSIRLGYTIPLHTFGPGLSIAHWGTIVVNGDARIGGNCRIHQGVTIGSSGGKSPIIGDNCFIGANASIIGGVKLGNNVRIGANSLVNRSFPDGAVLVGIPARNLAGSKDAADVLGAYQPEAEL